jgi:ATP-dependent Clp protease protease subunit
MSGMEFYQWEQLHTIYSNVSVQSSLTPYILEERELRVTQMDIFSRLMMDRIIWLAGPVNDRMSTVVQAQLLFLEITKILLFMLIHLVGLLNLVFQLLTK